MRIAIKIMEQMVQQMQQQLAQLTDQVGRQQQQIQQQQAERDSAAQAEAARQQHSNQQIADLQGQISARAVEAATLRAELSAMSSIEELTTGITTGVAAAIAATGRESSQQTLIDIKGIGKPPVFGIRAEDFQPWVRKVENLFVATYTEEFRGVLHYAMDSDTTILATNTDLTDAFVEIVDLKKKIGAVFTALIALTEDESNDIVVGAGDGQGLEAWRRLHRRWDPSTGRSRLGLLNMINNPPNVKMADLHGALERWLQQISRFERRKGPDGVFEKVGSTAKCAALYLMVPQNIKNHFTLNTGRLKTFDDYYQELCLIMDETSGSSVKPPSILQTGGGGGVQPMDVDSLGTKGGGKGKGKGGWKGGGQGAGKGSTTQFQGYCDNCGKWGHKKADCWAKPKDGSGKPDTKKGDGGKKDDKGKGKGKKGKGKGKKGKAGSLEQEGQEEEWPEEWPAEEPEQEVTASLGSFEEVNNLKGSDTKEVAGVQSNKAALKPGSNEWVRVNLDSGASVTTFPKAWSSEELAGSGSSYKTASGELIEDRGGAKLCGRTEHGEAVHLEGRFVDVHKTLASAARVASKGKDIWLTHDGGWVYDRQAPVAAKINSLLWNEYNTQGYKNLVPLWQEGGVYNLYLKLGTGSGMKPLGPSTKQQSEQQEFGALSKLGSDERKKRLAEMTPDRVAEFCEWALRQSASAASRGSQPKIPVQKGTTYASSVTKETTYNRAAASPVIRDAGGLPKTEPTAWEQDWQEPKWVQKKNAKKSWRPIGGRAACTEGCPNGRQPRV